MLGENFPSQGFDFSYIFPSAPPEAIHLLKQFLSWNPETRISFEEALQHPFIRESKTVNWIRANEKIASVDDDLSSVQEETMKLEFYKEIVTWSKQCGF